jgi:hypothetical protein
LLLGAVARTLGAAELEQVRRCVGSKGSCIGRVVVGCCGQGSAVVVLVWHGCGDGNVSRGGRIGANVASTEKDM